MSGKNSDVTTHARPSCSAEYALPSQLSLLGHEPNRSHEPACAEFALPHQHLMLSQELNRNGQNRSCARVSLTSPRAECALLFQRLLLGLEPKWSHDPARAELALPQQRLLLSQATNWYQVCRGCYQDQLKAVDSPRSYQLPTKTALRDYQLCLRQLSRNLAHVLGPIDGRAPPGSR